MDHVHVFGGVSNTIFITNIFLKNNFQQLVSFPIKIRKVGMELCLMCVYFKGFSIQHLLQAIFQRKIIKLDFTMFMFMQLLRKNNFNMNLYVHFCTII